MIFTDEQMSEMARAEGITVEELRARMAAYFHTFPQRFILGMPAS